MSSDAKLVITVRHSRFAFIYSLFKANIAINGRLDRKSWGTHAYTVPPGNYFVEISYPWLFSSECGKNSTRITLHSGQAKRITYTARMLRYFPGKIVVHETLPTARALPPGPA